MTYRLPSLRLETQFDLPRLPLRPGEAATGARPHALRALEGAARGPHVLARLQRSESLLVLDVAPFDEPLALTVVLLADQLSDDTWQRADDAARDPATPRPTAPRTAWVRGARVVALSVSGRLAAAGVLQRATAGHTCTQRLTTVVQPSDLDPEGTLSLTLSELSTAPAWLSGRVEHPLAGVAVARVRLGAAAHVPGPTISCGREAAGGRALVPRSVGGLVVNPATTHPPTLALAPRTSLPRPPLDGDVGTGRRLREVVASARDRAVRHATGVPQELPLEVTTLVDGRRHLVRIVVDDDGWNRLMLDTRGGPVACRPLPEGAAARLPGTGDWWAEVS